MTRAGLVVALTLALCACGFHMVGSQTPALDSTAVVHEQSYRVVPPPLVDILEQRLDSDTAGARNRLVIHSIDTEQRVLAVSPQDARATAYELTTTVHFDFRVDGEQRLQDESLSARREYSFDNSQRLAAENERRELLADMQAELADLILLRLEAELAE